ncbi:MAG TPA: aldehyde dehydrogenase family protein, partial [Rhodobacteraceae bacterium]|nr:aldehyde dehydrogenase family protein [Paracoccaceae bacterium]
IGHYAMASAIDTFQAIEAASNAVKSWSRSTSLVRAEALDKIGTEIVARKDELGDMLAREEGKTLREATAEAHRAGSLFKYFAQDAFRETVSGFRSIRDNVELEVRREPIGVVGVITPWNFPLAIPAWKIAPALAYGNTVVFKPAELVPGSAWMLSDIISRAGLPEGVFNLVMGHGRDVGQAIVDHPDVAGVSFTGSTAVGRKIGAALFQRGARMQLEMGGKNPLIVLDDADLDLAVECAVQGAYFSTGQRCTASSRLIVTRGIHDAFIDAMTNRLSDLKVGDARDLQTQMGPVVSAEQLDIDKTYIEIGRSEGAELIHGGMRPENMPNGYYLAPTLFASSSNEMRINREEIFGPIASVQCVGSYDEALHIANDTDYGLSGGIITTDINRQRHFRDHAQVGMVQINLPTAGMDFHAPFTGKKGSSYGPPEKGGYAREFFTAAKVVHEGRG